MEARGGKYSSWMHTAALNIRNELKKDPVIMALSGYTLLKRKNTNQYSVGNSD